jgi:pyrroloquinoline quinone biosynthesis protein B
VRVFAATAVQQALSDTIVRMLERFCGVEWQTLEPGRALPIDGSSLVVERFETGDDEASGLAVRDSASGGALSYAPALAALDDGVLARFAASDLVLVDGTFWRELETLAGLERPRTVLVHINNTNPILLEDSPEREAVVRAGVEVAYDGLEVQL